MKKFLLTLTFLTIAFSGMVFAADKLAVAEPIGKGGVKAEEIEALWGILETSIQSEEYKVISRGALKQMMTEIGLTETSGLVNMNAAQKAKLGQLDGVKYILITEVGKFGSRYNCTLRIIDSSTGEIDQARTYNLRVKDFDELADKIESALETLLSDEKNQNISAIIFPVVLDKRASRSVGEDFNARMEQQLLRNGVRLRSIQSIKSILQKNNISPLYELEPAKFKTVGKLLESKYLIQVVINRFSVTRVTEYNSLMRQNITTWKGNISGFVKVLYGTKSEIRHVATFNEKINFSDLDIDTEDWTPKDYELHLIDSVIPAITKEIELKLK